MNSSLLQLDRWDDGLLVISLNRPRKRNAISAAMRAELWAAFSLADAHPDVRAVLLRAVGGNFSAGGDVGSMMDMDHRTAEARMHDVRRTALAVAGCRKPTVAAVDGVASGGGIGLALLCDEVVALPSSRFDFSFARLGLVADWGLSHTLAARVGRDLAAGWIAGGHGMTGTDAATSGLVDHLAEEGALQDTALKRVTALSAGAAIRNRSLNSLRDALRSEAADQVPRFLSAGFRQRLLSLQQGRRGPAANSETLNRNGDPRHVA